MTFHPPPEAPMPDIPLARVVADLAASAIGPRCLVTGARGFLGSRLVAALEHLGCSVVAVDADRTPSATSSAVMHRRLDLCERRTLDDLLAFHPADIVFHCAAHIDPTATSADAVERVVRDNVVGTANVLAGARKAGVKRLVFLSSYRVAEAEGGQPVEDAVVRSMRDAERAVRAAHRPGHLQCLVVRSGEVWGPGGALLQEFLHHLAAGTFGTWLGPSRQPLPVAHRDNVVRALLEGGARRTTRPDAEVHTVSDGSPMPRVAWFAPLVEALGYSVAAVQEPRRPSLVASLRGWMRGARSRASRQLAADGEWSASSSAPSPGWTAVVSRDEGLEGVLDVVHRLHTTARTAPSVGALPFRAPDSAFFEDAPPKYAFLIWDRAPKDRAKRQARLVHEVGAALQAHLDVQELTIDVDGPNSRVRSPSPFPLGARPLAGLLTVRSPSEQTVETVEEVLSRHGFDSAGYRVESTVLCDYGGNRHSQPRDWPDGTESPGVVAVTCFPKPERMAYEAWLAWWHNQMGPVSEAIQPRTRYVRNRVVEPVTDGAPPVAGIVEECFGSIDDVRNPRRFYGADSTASLIRNIARILWTVTRFLPLTQVQTTVMTETLVVSPQSSESSHSAGGATHNPGAPGVE